MVAPGFDRIGDAMPRGLARPDLREFTAAVAADGATRAEIPSSEQLTAGAFPRLKVTTAAEARRSAAIHGTSGCSHT